jgi:hypothetical protein
VQAACGEDEQNTELLDEDQRVNVGLLRRHFSKEQGTIKSLEVRLGKEMPVEWDPSTGLLCRDGETFFLRWEFTDFKARLRIRMAYQCPVSLEYRGQLNRDGGSLSFKFVEACKAAHTEDLHTVTTGNLSDSDFELWKTICSPGRKCPICDRAEVHLLEEVDPLSFRSQLMFTDLRLLRQGWVMLRANQRQWHFFRTGLQIEGITFVVLDGVLHWSQARGRVFPLERGGDVYTLSLAAGGPFYLCRV